jgi:hypothetical protein
MTSALLAWGSLLWDEGAHPLNTAPGSWTLGDLLIPREFSRGSWTRAGALTVVSDPENGGDNPTYFVVSALDNLEEASCNLREREGTGNEENSGFVDCRSGQSRCKLPTASSTIREWAE